MLFLVDTCFWLHIQHIFQETNLDLRPIFGYFRWGYTKQILDEYVHFNLNTFIPLDSGYRIPLLEDELLKFKQKYPFLTQYDLPDQTLACCGIRDASPILTDDGAIYVEMKSLHQKVYLLPSFCLWLTHFGFLKKNTCAQLLRFWETDGLYDHHKIKGWKNELKNIH